MQEPSQSRSSAEPRCAAGTKSISFWQAVGGFSIVNKQQPENKILLTVLGLQVGQFSWPWTLQSQLFIVPKICSSPVGSSEKPSVLGILQKNQREGSAPPSCGMKGIYSDRLAEVKARSWCLPNNNYSKNNKANAVFILFVKAQP